MATTINGTTGIDKIQPVSLSDKPNLGFKNYIINGNFDIWQRGTSQTTAGHGIGYGSDDRWYNDHVGSTKTHSRIACTDTERDLFNAQAFSRTVVSSVTGSENITYKDQRIEDVTKLAGKTVTLSFWAKADASKNISVEFMQVFGTGGTPSSTVNGISVQKLALTTTWQKFTKTVTLPSIVGKTLGTDGVHTSFTIVRFWFDAGTNFNSRTDNLGHQSGTFDIAQVQLEEGSVATPFEQRPIGLELSLCQRYYEVVGGSQSYFTPNTTFYQSNVVHYKVRKRVVPTVSVVTSGVAGRVIIIESPATYSSSIILLSNTDRCSVVETGATSSNRSLVNFDQLFASAEL